MKQKYTPELKKQIPFKAKGLLSKVKLTIKTSQGEKLLGTTIIANKTSKKMDRLGLIDSGLLGDKVWNAASLDDPFADHFLIKIITECDNERDKIQQEIAKLKNLTSSFNHNLKIHSVKPINKIDRQLNFSTPIGYYLSVLVSDIDDLVLWSLAGIKIGLIEHGECFREINESIQRVRKVFNIAYRYKTLGVNRLDVVSKTNKGLKAIALFPKLPHDVLYRVNRSKLSPKIKSPSDLSNFITN